MSRTSLVLLVASLSLPLLVACGGRTALSLRDAAAGRGGADVDTAGTTGSPAGSGGSTGKGGAGTGGAGGAGMSGSAGSSGQSTGGSGGSPTCSDGVQNGAETGLDCGGVDCPPCVTDVGCADGTRESFLDPSTYTRLAACSGGWSVPGTRSPESQVPACAHGSGNSSGNPSGVGCSVADLCAVGWHVCSDVADVVASTPPGVSDPCVEVAMMAQPLFFTTRQSGNGYDVCESTGDNDLFGCGNIGVSHPPSCHPLNFASSNLCVYINDSGEPWECGPNSVQEALQVIKTSASRGGALCCKD